MPLLVLFDVDGTIFVAHDPIMGKAVLGTLEEVYGVSLPEDAIAHVDHPGQTTKRIGRLVLRQAGVTDAAIDKQLDAWCERATARYLELLEGLAMPDWRARSGAAEALDELTRAGHTLGLLTGNPEPAARERMRRIGLAPFFPPGQGAFGCDGEARSTLLSLARERAGNWPAERTIAVGDTFREIGSAEAAGLRSVAIASGRVDRFRLAGADAVVDTMPELVEVLTAWEQELGGAAGA